MKPTYFVAVLALAACTCCTAPKQSTMDDLRIIKQAYSAGEAFEPQFCQMRPAGCEAARTAHYNAGAALMTAEGDPTDATVKRALEATNAYLQAERL